MFSCDGFCCCGSILHQQNTVRLRRLLASQTIQRAYRTHSLKRLHASRLAFAMGMHDRLGDNSQLLALNADLASVIWRH